MTLNGHFALKSVSGSATNGLASLSDKTVRKLAELPIYCQRQKRSPGNVVSGSIRFMQIFTGVRWRVGSLKMSIFASFVHCLRNILRTWLRDSFQVVSSKISCMQMFAGVRWRGGVR